jgi:hypothetical protein
VSACRTGNENERATTAVSWNDCGNGKTRKESSGTVRAIRYLAIVLGLATLTHGAVAAPVASLQTILALGDPVGDVLTLTDGYFGVGPLNDRGELCFSTESDSAATLLVQYADSRFTPIAEAGGLGPLGQWPENLWFDAPVGMNQGGSVAFSGLLVQMGDTGAGGTFLWGPVSDKVTPVAVPGMPSIGAQRFEWAAGPAPAINDSGEVAFVAMVKNAAGRGFYGVFHHGTDNQLTPIAVPDQMLADGQKIVTAYQPSLRDDGTLALLIQRQGDARENPYLWQQGAFTPVPVAGVRQIGKLLIGFDGVWVNDRNRNVLLAAQLHALSGHYSGLYLIADGQTIPVAVPGQTMPGGGRMYSVQAHGVSVANAAGQHAFLASLDGGVTAAYLMQADGTLSLILKSGMVSSLGKITSIGQGTGESWGIGLNGRGQVALTVSLANGPDRLVLLPAAGS